MLTKQDLENWIKTNSGEDWRTRLADYIVANSRAKDFYGVNCLISEAICQVSSTDKPFNKTQKEIVDYIWAKLKVSAVVDEGVQTPAFAKPLSMPKVKPASDNVNHPAHYTSGQFETIDIIKDNLTPEQFEGFCIGNVIKYVTRYKQKNGLEDLEKARWYLDKIISVKGEQK